MRIECSKFDISEYGFLRLYSSIMIVQNKSPIIENHQLEKDLYRFYSDPRYHFLFEDIVKKEDKVQQENSHVDLGAAFHSAYAWGLLTMIHDSSNLKSIINFSQDEAKCVRYEFPIDQVSAMEGLCTEITELKKTTKGNVLLKKSNTQAN